MTLKLKYMPIRLRLMIIMMVLAIAIIGLSTVITIYHDIHRLKQQLIQETKVVSKVLAQDFIKCSLLDTPEVVADTISKISAFPMILHVDVLDQQSKKILHYSIDLKEPHLNPFSKKLNPLFIDQRLLVETPLIYQNMEMGRVLFAISTDKIERRLEDIYRLLIYSVPASLLFSIFSALILQRFFSNPIISFKKSVERIADQQDFNFRLTVNSADKSEIAVLQHSFNAMLSQLQDANYLIKNQKERIQITLDSIGDAVIATDLNNKITLMNPVACQLTGWTLDDALSRPLEDVFHIINTKTRQIVENPTSKVIESGDIVGLASHTSLISREGIEYQVMDSAAPIFDHNRFILGVILVFHDVSGEYQAQQKIEESEVRFKLMANASPTMIWQTDAQGKCIFVNETMQEFTGLSVKDLTENWKRVIHPDDLALLYSSFYSDTSPEHKERIEIEYRLLKHTGEYRHVHDVGTALINSKALFIGYIGSCIDITERKQAEDRANYLASYDSLTDLPNRRLFVDRFNQVLIRAKRNKSYGIVLFIDLDHFKTLNDSLGHSVGDLLLQEVANRLRLTVRAEDTVARLGGDEFIVLSGELTSSSHAAEQHAQVLADKVFNSLAQPYLLDNYEHINTSSIGISIFSEVTESMEECIKQADTAMYKAKSMGRNNYCFYSIEMQQAVDTRLNVEKMLRVALKEQQFSLFYQPKVNMNGNIIGAEALIRWIKPDGEFISPDHFIPIAEETGLIVAIGEWVLKTAISQLQQWENQDLVENFQLAINVSPRQFHQENFVELVSNLYQSHQIVSNQVTLEITEGVVVEHLNETIEVMNQLRKKGFNISLDDFGTGYSSLSYLKQMPLDEIKIDRSFMQGIPNVNSDVTIIKTICMVAESFKMKTVAEGVEEQIQLDFLEKLNCNCYQGYLFSPPINAEKFTTMLKNNLD